MFDGLISVMLLLVSFVSGEPLYAVAAGLFAIAGDIIEEDDNG